MLNGATLKQTVIDIIRAYTFFDETHPSDDLSLLHWSDFEKQIVNDYADKIPSVMRQVMKAYKLKWLYHDFLSVRRTCISYQKSILHI